MARVARPAKNFSTALSVSESKFVSEYLIDGNGVRSAIDSGWCARDDKEHAGVIATRMLKQPRVLEAINEQLQASARKNLITVDRLMLEVYRLATYNVQDAYDKNGDPIPLNKLPEDLARCIEGYETESVQRGAVPVQVTRYKFAKKSVALQMLFEQLIGAVRRLEVTGRNGAPLFNASSSRADLTEISTELLEKIVAMSELKEISPLPVVAEATIVEKDAANRPVIDAGDAEKPK